MGCVSRIRKVLAHLGAELLALLAHQCGTSGAQALKAKWAVGLFKLRADDPTHISMCGLESSRMSDTSVSGGFHAVTVAKAHDDYCHSSGQKASQGQTGWVTHHTQVCDRSKPCLKILP